MIDTFEGTTIERDSNGMLWMRDKLGGIACEVFQASEDETAEDMMNKGFIMVPYRFEGEQVFVEVAE